MWNPENFEEWSNRIYKRGHARYGAVLRGKKTVVIWSSDDSNFAAHARQYLALPDLYSEQDRRDLCDDFLEE